MSTSFAVIALTYLKIKPESTATDVETFTTRPPIVITCSQALQTFEAFEIKFNILLVSSLNLTSNLLLILLQNRNLIFLC